MKQCLEYINFTSGVFHSTVNIYVQSSHSKSTRVQTFACMAGLLTYFILGAFPSYLFVDSGRGYCPKTLLKLTAAGSVQDLHLIPFYFLCRMATEKPIRCKSNELI